MPTLESIVQKMIDAGESEETIAQVIRAKAAEPKPLNADEPDTYWSGFLKGAKEGAVGGAKGFAKGVVPGAFKAIAGIVPGIVNAAIGTVKGGANLVTDPVKTLTEAYEAVKGIPGKGGEMLQQALDLAQKDPEAFGKAVGEVTGGTAAGIALAGAAPLAPKPIARGAGRLMETVGKEGKWPIRMMGAHQLGSGNPMGIATMMLPDALRTGGAKLTEFGTSGAPKPPTPAAIRTQDRLQDQFETALSKKNVRMDVAAEKAAQDAATAADIARARQGLEPETTFAETVSTDIPGGRSSMTTRFKPAEAATEAAAGGDPLVAEMLKRGLNPNRVVSSAPAPAGSRPTAFSSVSNSPIAASPAAASTAPVGGYSASAELSTPSAQEAVERLAGQARPVFQNLEQQGAFSGPRTNRVGVEAPVSRISDITSEGVAAARPGELPAPGLTIGSMPGPTGAPRSRSLGPIEQQMLKREKVPSSKIPASRSSREMSATPGLSREDALAIGLNPDLKITGLTPEAIELLLAERAARSGAYRTNAGLDSGAMMRALLERE